MATTEELRARIDALREKEGAPPEPSQEVGGFVKGTPRKAAVPSKAPANLYPGQCVNCGVRVEGGEGGRRKGARGWEVFHVGSCPERKPVGGEVTLSWSVQPAEDPSGEPAVWPGVYTLVDPPSGAGHRTFRVRVQPQDADFAPGATVLEHLTGSDNTGDYTSFAFVKGTAENPRLAVWKRHRSNTGLVADAEAFLVDPEAALESKHCIRCDRPLTTPESIAAGIGPVCVTMGDA